MISGAMLGFSIAAKSIALESTCIFLLLFVVLNPLNEKVIKRLKNFLLFLSVSLLHQPHGSFFLSLTLIILFIHFLTRLPLSVQTLRYRILLILFGILLLYLFKRSNISTLSNYASANTCSLKKSQHQDEINLILYVFFFSPLVFNSKNRWR